MSNELKPCPFCGEESLLRIESCYVHCRSCCTDGPVMDHHHDNQEAYDQAIVDLWNDRPQMSA